MFLSPQDYRSDRGLRNLYHVHVHVLYYIVCIFIHSGLTDLPVNLNDERGHCIGLMISTPFHVIRGYGECGFTQWFL